MSAKADPVPASAADLPAVKELLGQCGLHDGDLNAAHMALFRLVKDGDALVGTVGLEGCDNYALLRSLAVRMDCRGRGLARRLVAAAEELARQNGAAAIYLLTLTAPDLFAKLGYRRTKRDAAPAPLQRTTEFNSLCPASAVCMVKKLTAGG